ncbi:MAG: glucosyltransferase domain-containing protein, partial [Lachnospiraceae bacterium]|nr:glucosyltransferase domain-containing protein [Lachnospiraceae bacterium]
LYVLSIIMMIWSFHTYQTFVITYVIMVGIAYIMMCLSGMVNEERRDTTWWALLLEHIVVFGIANVVGQIATSIFFISSGYLESTFLWKTASLGTCFKNIMTHMRLIFFGSSENIFFTAYYGIIAFLVVILIFREFLMNRKVYFFIMLLAAIGIQFTPLLITIYTGSMPSIRGQLNYPLVMIFDGFICFILVSEKAIKWKKFAQIGLSSILVIMLWQQISVTMRLVYTNEVRADEDVWLAQTLNMRLIEMDATNKPVAFIGGYDNMLNAACVRGEIIGRSVFSMFTDSEPHYTASTWHACSVMNTIGIQMRQADDSQIECARRIAVNMPIWPARDSVLDMGDYVIVKLGTEQWAEEIMAVDSMPISEEQVQYTNNLAATINPIRYNGNETLITGWCFGEDIIPCDFISKVYLKHNESRQFCLSGTSAVKR